MSNGFALESEDRETPIADLPEHEEGDAQTLPLIWANPVTGEKALQFHAIIARRLHIKESADGPVRIVDDVRQVRKILYEYVSGAQFLRSTLIVSAACSAPS